MKKIFSTYDIAKICHVTPATVIRWIRDGQLPASVTPGGHNRIQPDDLLQLLEKLRMPIPSNLKEETHIKNRDLKILIVDDDDQMRTMLTYFFKKDFNGCLVEQASDGFTAGWRSRVLQPDIIFLDIQLPDINGSKVCELIRNSEHLQHTKIIAMTGFGEDEKEGILEVGADMFLPKPFKWKEVKEKVKELVGT